VDKENWAKMGSSEKKNQQLHPNKWCTKEKAKKGQKKSSIRPFPLKLTRFFGYKIIN